MEIFENSFKMSEALNKHFYNEARLKLNYKGGRAVLSALTPLAVLITGISLAIYASTSEAFYLLTLIVGFAIAVVTVFFGAYFDVRDRERFGRKDFVGASVKTVFFDDRFEWTVGKISFAIRYENVWRIIATDALIILLFDKGSPVKAAAAVSRFDFKIGTANDFVNFLKNKCPSTKWENRETKQALKK